MVPEPSALTLVGLALIAMLAGTLLLTRRRRAVRLVGGTAVAPPLVLPAAPVASTVERDVSPDVEPGAGSDAGSEAVVEVGTVAEAEAGADRLPGLPEEPVFAPLPEVEPLVPDAPATSPAPAPSGDLAAEPPGDPVSRAYVELSRALAARGRWHDAALALWAADLHTLGPLLRADIDRLAEGLRLLTPLDAASAVTGARALAASLLGPSAPTHMARLADASHLTGPFGAAPAGRAPAAVVPGHGATSGATCGVGGDVTAQELPDDVLVALQTVLQGAAETGGDATGRSVGLRCDVVAHLLLTPDGCDGGGAAAPGHGSDRRRAESVARQVLEPHERPLLDRALAARAS